MNKRGKAYPVLLAVCFLGLACQESRAQLFTVTPHDLLPEQKILVEGDEVPQWKALWDKARKSALQGDFQAAVRQYRNLLILKSDLEEARWELARLMMYLKRWDEAAELLELLIEEEPESSLYVNALGKVMWEMGQYERSVDLFKRVYDRNPSDQTALAGLVEGLIRLDRKNEALPYLEQLARQEPTNRGVRRYLAFLLYDAGYYEKAREHLTILARNDDVELDVLYRAAKTYEHLGMEQQASSYWERVLVREPENIEAHLFLAGYYEKEEQLDRALSHLLAVIEQNPEDVSSYVRLGEMYERAGEYTKAQAYYARYLERYPDDPVITQRLAAVNTAMAQKRKTQVSVRDFAASDAREQVKKLQAIIRKLEAAGRYQDAIPFYRELIAISPEDHAILAALANDLIAIRKSKGSVSMLDFLGAIAPDNVAVYRSLAELLRRLEREEELLAVLEKIHELEPRDVFAIQELTILYLKRGELQLSRRYFGELADADCWNSSCLETRASLAGNLDMPAQQLRDYEALLKQEPGRDDIRLEVIGLAADMGLLDTAVFHAGYLQVSPAADENPALQILLADAYRKSGYFSRAVQRYQNIIEQTSGEKQADIRDFRIRAWLGMAESYEKLGLVYEAEQTLREALVLEESRVPILEELFHLFLRAGRIAESETWLQALNHEMNGSDTGAAGKENLDWQKEFFQAEMYGAGGDHDLAADLYRQAETLLPVDSHNQAGPPVPGGGAPRVLVQMHLAASLLQLQEYAEAEKIVLGLQKNSQAGELELLALLEKIYRAWGKNIKAEKIAGEAGEYAASDFGRQLALAALYQRYNDTAGQSVAAAKAVTMMPESLAAKHLLVDAKIRFGEYPAALVLLDQFLTSYPENTWFLSEQAVLLAKVGRFQESLAVADMILAENPGRVDIILLQARIFWEMNRWKDSVGLYESMVEPPVEEILEQKIQQLHLAVDRSPSKNSWWEVVTFSEGAPLTVAQVIMSPQHAVDFSKSGQLANSVAARNYALYRWQDRFSKELSVRRSVMRREYYHAANKLENVIREYGSNDFLLYDLAGLYSKLERLGDEAGIYRELEARNAHFPGIAEAVQRNDLKRRPRVSLAYVMREDDGWDGYMAVRQEIYQGGGSYYRTTNQEWSLDLARIKYASTQDEQKLWAWRTLLSYDARLSQSLGLSLNGGFEKLESGYDDTLLMSAAVTGKIADEMRAVFSAKQDVEPDTLASLERNIKRRDYKIELMFDLFPRLLLGGYYDLISYSDSNWTNNYTFWASYIVLPEPTLLKITYNYDFYDSHEGPKPGVPSDDGFAPDDHPYWCPVNYWVTRFSFYFKHQLSNDTLARGVPSYYTLEYSLGYDAEDNDLHELKGSLNIEIAKSYILSASYGFIDMGVYDHKEGLLSLTYRF